MNETTNTTQPSGAITLTDLEKCMDEAKANAVQPYPELPLWVDFTSLFDEPQTCCIGTHTDENGVEHEVWQHVFTPANWTFTDVAKCLCATGHSSTWATPSDKTLNQWRREQSQDKRAQRWQKIRRRQRRAAQRRHNRGGI